MSDGATVTVARASGEVTASVGTARVMETWPVELPVLEAFDLHSA